jgi:hypothetical protein
LGDGNTSNAKYRSLVGWLSSTSGNALFWSGFLLRLANGRTPIGKRGAIGGEIANVAGLEVISGGTSDGLVAGHSNQDNGDRLHRRSRSIVVGVIVATPGRINSLPAIQRRVLGRNAKTCTDRAMFLTLCSPLPSN